MDIRKRHLFLKRYCQFAAVFSLMMALFWFRTQCYIWGSGFYSEDEITFGLLSFLGVQPASFISFDFFYFGIILSLIWSFFLFILKKEEVLLEKHKSINIFCIFLFSFLNVFLVFHIETFRDLTLSLELYDSRVFSFLDEWVDTNNRVEIEMTVIDLAIMYYGTVVLICGQCYLIVNGLFYNRKKIFDELEHLIE